MVYEYVAHLATKEDLEKLLKKTKNRKSEKRVVKSLIKLCEICSQQRTSSSNLYRIMKKYAEKVEEFQCTWYKELQCQIAIPAKTCQNILPLPGWLQYDNYTNLEERSSHSGPYHHFNSKINPKFRIHVVPGTKKWLQNIRQNETSKFYRVQKIETRNWWMYFNIPELIFTPTSPIRDTAQQHNSIPGWVLTSWCW